MISTMWGDGFWDDGWADFMAVRSWETCSTDELVRYFPGLCDDEASIPSQALTRLADSIDRRTRDLTEGRPAGPAPAAGPGRPGDAAKVQTAWWSCERLMSSGLRTLLRAARCEGASDAEHRALVFLRDVFDAVRSGSLASPDEAVVTAFAFHSSIHPAYLWPGAVLSHDRATAACWLGHVARGRPVLLPSDIAEYMLDGVERRCGTARFRDQHLAKTTAGSIDVETIMLAAVRRSAGRRVIVRQRRPMVTPAARTDPGLSDLASPYGPLWPRNEPSPPAVPGTARFGRDAASSRL